MFAVINTIELGQEMFIPCASVTCLYRYCHSLLCFSVLLFTGKLLVGRKGSG